MFVGSLRIDQSVINEVKMILISLFIPFHEYKIIYINKSLLYLFHLHNKKITSKFTVRSPTKFRWYEGI